MWTARIDGGPQKVNHAAVVVDDQIFCIGGYSSNEDVQMQVNRPMEIAVLDTWTLRWRRLPDVKVGFSQDVTESLVPYHRYGHSAVVFQRSIYVWGGRNDISGACNTLFRYDVETNQWSKPAVSGRLPERRDGHSAAILNDTMYIFGGFEEAADRFSNDLFSLHIPSLTWRHIQPIMSGHVPRPRDFATLEAIGHQLILWGGRADVMADGSHSGAEVYDNCTYIYDLQSNCWTHTASHPAPPARRSHGAFVYQQRMFVFGGFNGKDHFADMWMYDPLSATWIERCYRYNPPYCPKARRRMACCVVGQRLFMFGGTSPKNGNGHRNSNHANPQLNDHDDLYIWEFVPSLKSLCRLAISANANLSRVLLPDAVRLDLLIYRQPNKLAKHLKSRLSNRSVV